MDEFSIRVATLTDVEVLVHLFAGFATAIV